MGCAKKVMLALLAMECKAISCPLLSPEQPSGSWLRKEGDQREGLWVDLWTGLSSVGVGCFFGTHLFGNDAVSLQRLGRVGGGQGGPWSYFYFLVNRWNLTQQVFPWWKDAPRRMKALSLGPLKAGLRALSSSRGLLLDHSPAQPSPQLQDWLKGASLINA